MKLILAADQNWAIGKDGDLLCHIPGDLKYFKEKTVDKTVIMGRTTLESLPGKKALPKRNNIVLSTRKDYKVENALVVHSMDELHAELKKYNEDDIFVIGGAKVYKDLLPLCDTCYITKIYKTFDGDRFFVNLDEIPEFCVTWESNIQEENGIIYQFIEYKRKK